MGKKMKTSARIQHAAARGEQCLVGQILFLLNPSLLRAVWRFR